MPGTGPGMTVEMVFASLLPLPQHRTFHHCHSPPRHRHPRA